MMDNSRTQAIHAVVDGQLECGAVSRVRAIVLGLGLRALLQELALALGSPVQARSAYARSIQEVDRVASQHFSLRFDGRVDSKIPLGLLH